MDQQKDTSNYGNPHCSPCSFLLNQVCLEFELINHQFSKALKHASSPINISRMSRIFQVKCAFKCFGRSELASGSFPQPVPPPVLGDPGEFSSKCSGHSAHSMIPGSRITHGGVGKKDKKKNLSNVLSPTRWLSQEFRPRLVHFLQCTAFSQTFIKERELELQQILHKNIWD